MQLDNLLVRKLGTYVRLSSDDVRLLHDISSAHGRRIESGTNIVHENETPVAVNFLLEGWAYRYKTLADGRRQILAILLPGDLCDLNVFILRQMDHSIGALTPVRLVALSRDAFDLSVLHHPRVAQALWWDTLVAAAIQREWTMNLGKRTAFERIAHLFCELFLRLRSIGLTQEQSCELPLTQADIADMAGLSTVHVNRTLQDLRAQKLIFLRGKALTILDLERLKTVSLFNDNYLHLDHEGGRMDADEA